ncbi:MAG: carboxypeptidase-like regulatory domain-containing protein [Flavobacteriales bacterium]
MKIKYSIKFLKVCSFIFFVFTISNLAKAQSLKGTVTEAESGEAIPMANVVIKSGDTIVQGGATDFDGNYIISPLSPGVYTVEVSFIGFETYILDSLFVNGKESFFVELKLSLEIPDDIEIIWGTPCVFDPPLYFSTGRVFGATDISALPITR